MTVTKKTTRKNVESKKSKKKKKAGETNAIRTVVIEKIDAQLKKRVKKLDLKNLARRWKVVWKI